MEASFLGSGCAHGYVHGVHATGAVCAPADGDGVSGNLNRQSVPGGIVGSLQLSPSL